MPPEMSVELPASVIEALRRRAAAEGLSLDEVVADALIESLGLGAHTLFQVSTSNALVQGVFDGSVTVGELRRRGDFGLGTFSHLDGEMVLLDGDCYRATAGGATRKAGDDAEVPFAMVTRFNADAISHLESADLTGLTAEVEGLGPSENVFLAIRVEGHFEEIALRAVCRAQPGQDLVSVTRQQDEYTARDVRGTLVGFWAPDYASNVTIPGHHLHFLSEDRALGGHVLGLLGTGLDVEVHAESDLHLALPETEEFLRADLSGDHRTELDQAERARRS